MSKKAIIELELKADGYKAEIADIQKANTAISDSATKAANQATEAYTQTGKAAKTAFASTEVQKALVTQGAAVGKFTESLSKITPAAKSANQSLEGIDKSVKKLNVDVPKTAKDVAALEDELRQLALEGKQNTEQFNLIAKAIGTFKASITIADRAVDLYAKTTDAATGRIGELEDKLYDLALAGQSNTKEFKDLVKEVANVRRAVIETDAQVDSLAQRGSSIKSFAQSVELVGVAFQAAEGAQALFGTDSEELQKTLVRLNAIMAITSAIEQGRQILLEQITAKTGIAAVAQRAYALAVGTSTGALRVFNIALASIGFGALLVAVSAIVLAIKSVIDENARFQDSIKSANKVLADSSKVFKEYTDSYDDIKRGIRVANGDITESQANLEKDLKDSVSKVAENLSPLIGAQRKLEEQIEITNNKIQTQINKIEFFKQSNSESAALNLASAQNKLNEETEKQNQLVAKLNEIRNEQNKILKAGTKEQNALREAFEADKNAEKRAEQQKKLDDLAKKAREEQLAARIRLLQLENEIFVNSLGEREKILNDSNVKIQELEQTFQKARFKVNSKEAIEAERLLADAILTIKNETNAKINAIDKEDIQKKLDLDLKALESLFTADLSQRIIILNAQRNLELDAADKLGKDKAEINKKYDDQILANKKEITQIEFRIKADLLKAEEALLGSSSKIRIAILKNDAEAQIKAIKDSEAPELEKAAKIKRITAETEAAIRAERKRTRDESIQLAEQYVAEVSNVLNELNELSKVNTQNSINDITARKDTEILAINQTLDTERDKIRQREAAELRANKKIGQEKQKQARRDKALALFQAGIDLATSIVKTGATLGYPAAIPFQITAGIVGAAQIAAIASQPIPKFEKGGEVRGKRHRDGGTLIEAEQGEYIINRNQTRRHSEEISALNRSTAEFHRLLERKYIQPRIASILSGTNRRSDKVVVNATLNARTMEGEIKGLRKDIRRSATKGYKSNQTDTRYQWQRN